MTSSCHRPDGELGIGLHHSSRSNHHRCGELRESNIRDGESVVARRHSWNGETVPWSSDTAVSPVGCSSTRALCKAVWLGSVARPLMVPVPCCAWALPGTVCPAAWAHKETQVRPGSKNIIKSHWVRRRTTVCESSRPEGEFTGLQELRLRCSSSTESIWAPCSPPRRIVKS